MREGSRRKERATRTPVELLQFNLRALRSRDRGEAERHRCSALPHSPSPAGSVWRADTSVSLPMTRIMNPPLAKNFVLDQRPLHELSIDMGRQ